MWIHKYPNGTWSLILAWPQLNYDFRSFSASLPRPATLSRSSDTGCPELYWPPRGQPHVVARPMSGHMCAGHPKTLIERTGGIQVDLLLTCGDTCVLRRWSCTVVFRAFSAESAHLPQCVCNGDSKFWTRQEIKFSMVSCSTHDLCSNSGVWIK